VAPPPTNGAWCQGRALAELRELEQSSAALAGGIQEARLAKRQLLDELVEAERQIMLLERKLQLEAEMQVCARCVWARGAGVGGWKISTILQRATSVDTHSACCCDGSGNAHAPGRQRTAQAMLDPSVGEGVVASMRKEVHRMELRHAELLRTQERLMQVRGDGACDTIMY
jgi:hypothetical protein